jgi:GNAT superfamily N-acetyltransferase
MPATLRAVRRDLGDGFELDDDRDRVDVDAVHRFLAEESYWARGRPREVVERLVREASRVVGLYHEGRQVGFSRTVFSEGLGFAYLADVYVLQEFRGSGHGVQLVSASVNEGPFAGRRWLLHTDDAHGLYEKFGFGPPGPRLMERAARPDTSGSSGSGT